ncbi:MAG: DUF962 domain-containing protein [Owenweeksia sp.]
MKSIHTWFSEYGVSHQNNTNKLIHWVCVPLIFFSILGLLAAIPADGLKALFPLEIQPYIHFGTVLIILALIFYIRLSPLMSIGLFLFSLLCLQGIVWIQSSNLPLWAVCIFIFVTAWIGQFIGHKIEGKKPSFIKDLQFLLIGPAWLMGFIYRKLNIPY